MSKRITLTEAIHKMKCKDRNSILSHLTAYNNGVRPDWNDLTKLFLLDFVEYLKAKIAQNSARTYCANLKSLLNKYCEAVTIPCKDYAKILSIKKVGTLNVYNTDQEIRLLIDYVPRNVREHTIRNQYVLSCLTGMRHSDVIKLDSKNKLNDVIFYLSQKTQSLVQTYSCTAIDKYLNEGFNTIYSDVTFNDTIRAICGNVGINAPAKIIKAGKEITGLKYQFITSHTARRSFATNLYLATKDLFIVSKLMGHSDVKITQTYICCDITDNDDVIEYFNQYNFDKTEM